MIGKYMEIIPEVTRKGTDFTSALTLTLCRLVSKILCKTCHNEMFHLQIQPHKLQEMQSCSSFNMKSFTVTQKLAFEVPLLTLEVGELRKSYSSLMSSY